MRRLKKADCEVDFFFIDEVSLPCGVEECGCYRLCRKYVNTFLSFPEFSLKRFKPRMTRINRIFSNVTDERAIFPLVTILLLFRIGVTKRSGPRITRLRATLRRGRPRIDANFSQSLWHSAILLSRNSCDSGADLIQNPKSDARTHRTPKALRANPSEAVFSPSAQADLWMERVVLNALATHAAWPPDVFAFGDSHPSVRAGLAFPEKPIHCNNR
jgi:hypothetical protein